MADLIDFADRRRAIESARAAEAAPNAGKHPKDVVVFEDVTLHDLWVRWTGVEAPELLPVATGERREAAKD
jgi:hypothetical protein